MNALFLHLLVSIAVAAEPTEAVTADQTPIAVTDASTPVAAPEQLVRITPSLSIGGSYSLGDKTLAGGRLVRKLRTQEASKPFARKAMGSYVWGTIGVATASTLTLAAVDTEQPLLAVPALGSFVFGVAMWTRTSRAMTEGVERYNLAVTATTDGVSVGLSGRY